MVGINDKGREEVVRLLDTIQKSSDRIREIIRINSSSLDVEKPVSVHDLMSKSWDELFQSGETEILKTKHPEHYKLKFKEAFGSEPN